MSEIPELPVKLPKISVWIMIAIAAGYFAYLIATWMQFQRESEIRVKRFNALLDDLKTHSPAADDAEADD